MSVGQWFCDHLQAAPPPPPPPVPIALPTPAWIEPAKLVLGSVLVLVLAYAVLVANAAVQQWRRHAAGGRRVLLAEDVLAGFYEAASLLQAALAAPLAGIAEAAAPLAELRRRGEFFAALHAKRFRFMSLFGAPAGEAFDTLKGLRERLLGEAGGGAAGPSQDLGVPAGERVREAVRAIEQACRPVIDHPGG